MRAGDGEDALSLLAQETEIAAIVLDMRFDRAARLLGDATALVARLGDGARARRFLEDNQGTYILAALREAGCALPVLISYYFGSEPRRFANLVRRYGPLSWLDDSAGPARIREMLEAALVGAPPFNP